MMKYLAIGLFLACSITTARSQTTLDTAHWQLVNNAAPQVSFMKWPSYDTGFFLGSSLSLTRTTDSGSDFIDLNFPKPIDTLDTNGHKVFSRDHAIGTVAGMSWADKNTGYVTGMTNSDAFHTSHPTVLRTTDGGTTWSQFYPSDTLSVITQANGIMYFPAGRMGYLSEQLSDQSENYISKTPDSGETWSHVYQSDSLSFSNLYFLNARAGMFIAHGVSYHLGYTTDGTNFTILPLPSSDSQANFVHWNEDGSWLAGIDSVYRSIDSGKHWTSVIPYDAAAGPVSVATFHDSVGFAFRANEPVVLYTTNYGASWKSSRLPKVGTDTILPVAASMPSDSEAYLLAQIQATSNVLMKIGPAPAQPINNGGVAMAPGESNQFSAITQGNTILFTANSSDRTRTIEVLDVLGRACALIPLPSGATTSQLATSLLRPGSYFARLGSAIVKFAVWN